MTGPGFILKIKAGIRTGLRTKPNELGMDLILKESHQELNLDL